MRTGLRVLAQGSPAWGLLRGEDARALFTGVGAHAISTMPSPVNSGAGLMLGTVAHTAGWPVPVGGTQVITDTLIADLHAHGGELVLGEPVTAPPDGVVIYDTAPTALLDIYGDAVPSRYAKALRRYRFGPGVCKVDFVLSGDIPWRDERIAQAPTVHMGGSRAQMALAEREIAAGRHAEWPMTLAALPHLADPSRIDDQGRRPLWTYAHVPAGSTADLTETITAMFEHVAPGFRDLVRRSAVRACRPDVGPQRQLRRRRHHRRRSHTCSPLSSARRCGSTHGRHRYQRHICAHRRRRRGRGYTVCAATMPPARCCGESSESSGSRSSHHDDERPRRTVVAVVRLRRA